MSKNIAITDETHKKAKILSAFTGLQLKEIFELLIEGVTEKDIMKLAKKNGKELIEAK